MDHCAPQSADGTSSAKKVDPPLAIRRETDGLAFPRGVGWRAAVKTQRDERRLSGFRAKLFFAMMLVVSTITAAGLYFAQTNFTASVQHDLQMEFQSQLASLHEVQEVRHASLAERCRSLALRPRIHAALEDDALDLLYLSAHDELHDLTMGMPDDPAHSPPALFYRFLDFKGTVIPPSDTHTVGMLAPGEEKQLSLPSVPKSQQTGYLQINAGADGRQISEVIATPIVSMESGQVIAALVVGFKPVGLVSSQLGAAMKSGIWMNDRLYSADAALQDPALEGKIAHAMAGKSGTLPVLPVGGEPYLFFEKTLNPGSLFPRASEVCFFSLADSLAREKRLRWQIIGGGLVLLLVALAVSHVISGQFSTPVERLAEDSEENREHRERAEKALEITARELQRSSRFAADASHQLKTPVTVLRAGLEELLARDDLAMDAREEISALVHETYRFTSVVEDLLLLAKMDDGRLRINFVPMNLLQLVDGMLDDLSAVSDAPVVEVDRNSLDLSIAGEERYVSIILQNLLENARKYNRPGGCIRIECRPEDDRAILRIGNTGTEIRPEAREHIFERFHRGSAGENVPGHGLGLNLARELARMHGGDLRLISSEADWTEFEVRFQIAPRAS